MKMKGDLNLVVSGRQPQYFWKMTSIIRKLKDEFKYLFILYFKQSNRQNQID